MIRVHHLNNSRSQRVLWLLEELGLDYEVIPYARDASMLAPPELKAIHPLGKSPIITDGDLVIAETGAIFQYLLDTYAEGRLSPPPGSEAYRQMIYWLHYAEGSAMPLLVLKLVTTQIPKRVPFFLKGVAKLITKGIENALVTPNLTTHIAYWEGALQPTRWFAGDRLSVADLMMSFPLEAAASRTEAGQMPNIKAFLARIHSRDAYKRALKRGGEYAYAN